MITNKEATVITVTLQKIVTGLLQTRITIVIMSLMVTLKRSYVNVHHIFDTNNSAMLMS